MDDEISILFTPFLVAINGENFTPDEFESHVYQYRADLVAGIVTRNDVLEIAIEKWRKLQRFLKDKNLVARD